MFFRLFLYTNVSHARQMSLKFAIGHFYEHLSRESEVPLKLDVIIRHFVLRPKYVLFLTATLIRHKYAVLDW